MTIEGSPESDTDGTNTSVDYSTLADTARWGYLQNTGRQVHYLPRPIVFIIPSVQRVSKLVSLEPELHSFQLHAQRLAKACRNAHGAALLFPHGLQRVASFRRLHCMVSWIRASLMIKAIRVFLFPNLSQDPCSSASYNIGGSERPLYQRITCLGLDRDLLEKLS
jgi:hypothetical protein